MENSLQKTTALQSASFANCISKTFQLILLLALVVWSGGVWGQTIPWTMTTGATAWYTATNWTPNTASGAWTTANLAQFNNTGTATTAGINMGTTSLSIGAIEVSSLRTRNLAIGNSSATVGTLTLNGITVNSVANTILRNASDNAFTLQDNETGSGKTMNIALGNSTDNLINVDGTGYIYITSIISGSGKNITRGGVGIGRLRFGAVNTFNGTFTANSGITDLGISSATVDGTLGSVSSVVVNTGAKLQTAFILGTNAINDAAAVTLNGTALVDLTGGTETVASLASASSTSSIVIGDAVALTTPGAFTVGDATASVTFAGVLSGSRATAGSILTKQGSGTWILTGANTYTTALITGVTTIAGGTLQLNRTGGTTIPNSSNVAVTGGTLRISSNQTLANLTVSSGANVLVDAGVTLTITGTLSNSGTVTLTGTAAMVDNGTVTINTNGILSCGTGTVSGSGAFTLAINATLQTANASGVTGSVTVSGTKTYSTAAKYIFNGATQVTGFPSDPITIGNLTISSSATVTLGQEITSNNNVVITSGTFANSNNKNITLSGNWTNSGTYSKGTETVTFTSNGTAQTISGTNTFNNLTLNHIAPNAVSASGTLAVTGLLRVQAGTFTSATQYNNVQIDNAATLALAGDISVSGNWVNNGTFLHNSFGVTFNGASAQDVGGTATSVFSNLTISNTTNAVTTTANIHSTGTLTINANAIFAPGAANTVNGAGGTLTGSGTARVSGASFGAQYPIEFKYSIPNMTVDFTLATAQTITNGINYGSITNSGNGPRTLQGINQTVISNVFSPGSGAYTINNSHLNFNGNVAQTIPAFTFYKVWFSGTGTKTLAGAIQADNDLSIDGGASLDVSTNNYAITVKGNWINGGTLTYRTGTVTFSSSTANQTITGNNTFYNLTANNTFGSGNVSVASTNLNVLGLMRVQAGTFTSATQYNNVQIDNAATLALGGNISVSGNWVNDGTFTHNNFGVTFNGTTTVTGATINQFKNLTIAASSSLTITGAGNLLVAGDWTSNGTFSTPAGAVTFNGTTVMSGFAVTSFKGVTITGSLTGPASGTFNVAGNWSNSGTFNANSCNVIFNGSTGNQTISNTNTFYNLTANNTAFLGTVLASSNITVSGLLHVQAGTFSNEIAQVNDVTIDLNSTYVLSSNDLFVNGNWSNSGTFNPSGNGVTFNKASGTQTVDNGSSQFFSVAHNGVSGTLQLVNSNMTINYAFINTAGSLDLNSKTMNLSTQWSNNGNASIGNGLVNFAASSQIIGSTVTQFNDVSCANAITLTVSQDFKVSGNWTNNGNLLYNTSTVTFNGSSAQTIGGLGNNSFYNLTLNNAAGANITGTDVLVYGGLTLTSGNLNIGTKSLYFTPAATAVVGNPGFSASNMIVADGGGLVAKFGDFPSQASFTFPVGDNNGIAEYSPITLQYNTGIFTGGYSYVKLSNTHNTHDNSTTNYVNRFWTVAQSGYSSFTCNVSAYYVDADIVGSEASIVTGKWNGALPWVKYALADAPNNKLLASNVSSFSEFAGISAATISIDEGASTSVCQTLPLTLHTSASGAPILSYLWSGGLGTASTASPSTASVGSTVYTVTVTDGNGSTATASINVTVNPPTVAGITNNSGTTVLSCANPSINLTATGGGTYLWSSGATPTNASQSYTAAGTYTVTVTDNGCVSTTSITLTGSVPVPNGDYQSFQTGNWNDPLTWNIWNGCSWVAAGAPPSSTDNSITILSGDTVTVNSAVTADQVVVNGVLTVSGNTLTLANGTGTDLDVNGRLVFSFGTIAGTGSASLNSSATFLWTGGTISASSFTLQSGSVDTLSSINTKTIATAGFVNNGTIDWLGGTISISSSSLFTNNGTLNIRSIGNSISGGSGTGVFTNSTTGIINKISSSSSSILSSGSGTFFNENGVINVLEGVLRASCNANYSNTGVANITGSAFCYLVFNSGTQTVNSGFTFAAVGGTQGIVQVSAATVTVAAGVIFDSDLTLILFTNCMLNWNIANQSIYDLDIYSTATLNLSGNINTSSSFSFIGGTINGPGTITIDNGSSGSWSTDDCYLGAGINLVNNGSMTWGSADVYMANSTFTNNSTLTITGNKSLIYNGNSPVFTNAGTITKSTGTGTTVLGNTTGISVVNTGTINVTTGTMEVSAASLGGNISVSSGATFTGLNGFAFNGTNFTNNGTTTNATAMSNSGTFKGSGAFTGSLFTNTGTDAPGNSPGCQTFGSGWTTSGTLNIEVTGSTPCTGHDKLNVTGTATLSGILALNITYTPAGNETITIIDAGTLTGTFTGGITGLSAGWSVNYNIGAGNVELVYGGCAAPSLSITQTNISCVPNNPTGSATVTATGGSSPYTYLWNDGSTQTTATATVLAADTYTVTVTATGGCSVSTSVTITGNITPPTVTASVSPTIICHGDSATLTAVGNAASYSWSPGNANTSTVRESPTKPKLYTVTGTNSSNGCTATSSVFLDMFEAIIITSVKSDAHLYGGVGTAGVTALPTGCTFNWSNGNQNSNYIQNLTPATYTVTVTSTDGCTKTKSITVN